jgi:NADPH:quinone reductase-like Zn-dependent oxidoreductase
MRAIQISASGNPADVLEVIDHPASRGGPGEALIGAEFAPVNRLSRIQ